MVDRRFGPILGAGTVVVEKAGAPLASEAAFGSTVFFGITERGETGKLIVCPNLNSFRAQCGSDIPESFLPQAAQDFYDHAAGGGTLYVVRVTAGDEVKSSLKLYSRQNPRQHVLTVLAKSGGRFAGQEDIIAGLLPNDFATDVTATTLDTGVAMLKDQYAGGTLKLVGVPSKTYNVVSNTIAGVITVEADSDMVTDYGSETDEGWILELPYNEDRNLSIRIDDGETNPTSMFSMSVFDNGVLRERYADLSMDSTSAFYVVNQIRDKSALITVTDENAGQSVGPEKRPANEFGVISAVTTTLLTITPFQFATTVGDTDATVTLGALTSAMKYRERLRIVFTSATEFDVYSLDLANPAGVVGGVQLNTATCTVGVAVTPATAFDSDWGIFPPFTVVAGSTAPEEDDEILLEYFPLKPGLLAGGAVTPDTVNAPAEQLRIATNTVNTVTITSGDLTANGAISDKFMLRYAQAMAGGYDGIANIADADYTDLMSPDTSPVKNLKGRNAGLVKLATPGVTATAVQLAGVNLADALNYQYRCEIPSNLTTESQAVDYLFNTLGRSNYEKVAFPSYGYISNPEAQGTKKLVPLTGMILGVEAKYAAQALGYHQAAAGVDARLFKVIDLPGNLWEGVDDEILNPAGIQTITRKGGSVVIWGSRLPATDPTWKFAHIREMTSHLGARFLEGFDWIIFALGNAATQDKLRSVLGNMMMVEFNKGAFQGISPNEAFLVKVDAENNTPESVSNGEMNAQVIFRPAGVVERVIITVSPTNGVIDTAA